MTCVGIDMIEIPRIKKCMKNKNFLKYILGEDEYRQLENRNFPAQSVAANFCVKEAFAKAVGKGMFYLGIKNIQALRDSFGRPYIKISGKAKEVADMTSLRFSVSITHTKEYASAVVVGYNS